MSSYIHAYIYIYIYILFSRSYEWAYLRTTCDCNAYISRNYIAVFVLNFKASFCVPQNVSIFFHVLATFPCFVNNMYRVDDSTADTFPAVEGACQVHTVNV